MISLAAKIEQERDRADTCPRSRVSVRCRYVAQ
jgi:hypothetical protein